MFLTAPTDIPDEFIVDVVSKSRIDVFLTLITTFLSAVYVIVSVSVPDAATLSMYGIYP